MQFATYNHTARVIKVGPDDKLYVSLGQPFNVAPEPLSDGEIRSLAEWFASIEFTVVAPE